jgi:hypothetical protein
VWGLYHFWSSSVGGPRAFAMLRDARQKPRDPTYRRIERVGEHYGLLVLKVGVLDLAGHLADKAGDNGQAHRRGVTKQPRYVYPPVGDPVLDSGSHLKDGRRL